MKALVARISWLALGVASLASVHCGEKKSCDSVVSDLSNALDDAQASADRSCSQDSDCAVVDFGVSCLPECNERKLAVQASAVIAAQAAVQSIDSKYCGQFGDQRCGQLPVSCAPLTGTLSAFCKTSQCELMIVDQ